MKRKRVENDGLSDYERKRLENIKRNHEMLNLLDIDMAASFLKKKSTSTPKSKMKMKVEPTRRSLRNIEKTTGKTQLPFTFSPPPVITTTNTQHFANGPVDAVPKNDIEEAESQAFLSALDNLNKETKVTCSILSEETSCFKSYKERISKLQVHPENVHKVVPNRITTMAIHPSCEKTVVCAGDKWGNVGFWDVEATNTENNGIYVYRPHIGCVRTMFFHPERNNELMSCSDDGTVRRTDLNSCVFDDLYASEDNCISSLSYPCNTRNTFLLGFGNGEVGVLDTRESSDCKKHWCHMRPIKCLHCSPDNGYLFCTSSSDATVVLWDLRKIKGKKSKVDEYDGHRRSINSAYFSPVDGKYILTTSWDDSIKILEVTPSTNLEEKQKFKHYNNTGRWLSTFKATWDPQNGRGFLVGSMLDPRRIQFYHAEQKTTPLLEKFSENFTTISSTNVFHPTKNIIASGNSSGKVFLWSE
ncbi:WD repeat-containing protein 76-like isoform X2 [Dendronephthya gigantea]|uniref:WD repeat-containing protein 76-like isoform X2 n=1 Tax=Dendronephthya gigantea TaxID=151771 RepID=UPI00106B2A47|nr:WD repeat-containing protein 76-like isoform X2 [Dendronephthya gigantea]